MNTKVTMHFTIEELYASKTAKDKGINNMPSVREMVNLVYLAAYVLEPTSQGRPLTSASTVTSRRAASGLSTSAST